jgi:pyruvate/2-oxoglutarate dehydrogenase complex dihydrolipoamide acyltransferase (E2) component
MATEIKLQALKENVDTVEVNAVRVNPGDTVAKDQPLLEVQADKAALEVPSPVAGRVAKVLVKPGDQVQVGQVYCLIEGGNGEAETARPRPKEEAPAVRRSEEVVAEQTEGTREPAPKERRAVENAVAAAPQARAPQPPAPPPPPGCVPSPPPAGTGPKAGPVGVAATAAAAGPAPAATTLVPGAFQDTGGWSLTNRSSMRLTSPVPGQPLKAITALAMRATQATPATREPVVPSPAMRARVVRIGK